LVFIWEGSSTPPRAPVIPAHDNGLRAKLFRRSGALRTRTALTVLLLLQ
jgi:hypothetical protein